MNNERIKNTCYILVLALCVLVIGYLSMRYVLPLLLPFLIAFFVGLAVKKPAAFLSEKTKLPVPPSLAELETLPERHRSVIAKEEMGNFVLSNL